MDRGKKYRINVKNENINILVFADDIALMVDNNKRTQKMMVMINEFCNYYGININYNGRDKSIYTTNENGKHFITFQNIESKHSVLPKIEKNKNYKYLGVNINLDLNWKKQNQISRIKMLQQLFFI
eukprot:Phypoly_transcript_10008.p1 GENE.Phypoly_transcript_10008~~Phypoly_transcript_10008.p1  ORF type:complete len:126 (-),score=19.01 Phypoly_transcript_10008:629-1006(-)